MLLSKQTTAQQEWCYGIYYALYPRIPSDWEAYVETIDMEMFCSWWLKGCVFEV